MSLPLELDRQLAALGTQLPALIADKPDAGDFWAAFAREADLIEDQAGERAAIVVERIAGLLAKHGRYLIGVDDAP